MLALQNINKTFGDKRIIKDINYEFKVKKVYQLSGANGSGKTTLLKLIKNIIIPDSGSVLIEGEHNRFNDVSYVDANTRSFLHRLSVRRNLEYFSSLNESKTNIKIVQEVLEALDLIGLTEQKFSRLSSGQAQIISCLRGIDSDPKVLLLDESLTNIDTKRVTILCEFLEQYASNHSKIIINCNHGEIPFKNVEDEIVLT